MAQHEQIHVKVKFPITKKGPYQAEDPPATTVGDVLAPAMTHFEVQDDSQFTYVLTFGGQEQNPTATIGSLAGDKDSIEFTMVKKITQG